MLVSPAAHPLQDGTTDTGLPPPQLLVVGQPFDLNGVARPPSLPFRATSKRLDRSTLDLILAAL